MIHGLTEIITKTKYGRVDRYKSENTFQGSIIAEGLRDLGYANANTLPAVWDYEASDRKPLCTEALGGIFLFQERVGNNAQFMNAGNVMIGNGAYGITNSGEPNELGSYNESQSEFTSSSVRFVYDFTQNQANGTISSVCLTSRTGGYIGYGNADFKRKSTLWNLWKNTSLRGLYPQRPSDFGTNTVICNGILYSFSLTGTDLTVKKVRVPIKNASVFDGIQGTPIVISVSSLHYSFFGNPFMVSADNGKVYLTTKDWYRLGTGYIWEYNPANDTVTELTFTDSDNYETMIPCVAKGKVFFQDGLRGNVQIYNLDGSKYSTISGTWTGGNWNDFYAGNFGNHVLLHWFRSLDEGNGMYLYDVNADELRPTNANPTMPNNFMHVMREDEDSKALTYQVSGQPFAFCNPLYLATINDLQTPRTKDATMTMQVRYTLTES